MIIRGPEDMRERRPTGWRDRETPMSTAEGLAAFRDELRELGFEADEVAALVIVALEGEVGVHGLTVTTD